MLVTMPMEITSLVTERLIDPQEHQHPFDTPIPTVTGEDPEALSSDPQVDRVQTDQINISTNLQVGGGRFKDTVSEFNGPVVFSQKLTSTSNDGIEANSLYLQGTTTVSRNYSVGIATPTTAGNAGDVVYNARPAKGGYLGWVYTTENAWYPFNGIGINTEGATDVVFDKVGVATDDSRNSKPEGWFWYNSICC